MSDIIEYHYGRNTRIVGALACFVYSAPILAMGGMMTMMQYLGLPVGWGLAATIGVCALYTTMGGLWADVLSDTIQFVLMCVSLAIAIPLALQWVGGWSFLEHLPPHPDGGASLYMQHHGGLSRWMLVAWAVTGVTVLIEPQFYQRVFAAKDDRAVPRALLIGILLWAAFDWGTTLIGMVAQAAVQLGLLPVDLEGRAALLTLCVEMLPLGLRGLMLGGILAAAMAQIDSYSLLASANIVYDIYRPVFDPHASERRLVLLTRAGVFVVMIAAALISLLFERMRDMWQFMASILAAVLLVPLMAALFARPRPAAGLWSALAGFIGLVAFYGLLFTLGDYNEADETHVWRLGPIELWQDYAVLCSLPLSLAGFLLGSFMKVRP
jgi:SSS family solute:Na+ symporter